MEGKKERFIKTLKLFFFTVLLVGLGITTYVVLKGQFELRRKADTTRVAEFLLIPNTVVVEPNSTFDITVWLNTHGREVVGVDVIFDQSTLLELVDIKPDYTYFPTFVPVDSNGAFDVTTAVSQNSFGAATFDWNNETDPISPPVSNAGVRLAEVTFRALAEGETVITIKYEGEVGLESTVDSNVVMIEEGTDIVADILSISDDSTVLVSIGMQQTCIDSDNDGYSSYNADSCVDGTDCNDNNSSIYPGALETCNNKDDNCDSRIDEDVFRSCLGTNSCDGVQLCENGQWGDCDCDCIPDCAGKQCGSDGCGGSCGSCGDNELCRSYRCLNYGYFFTPTNDCTEGNWSYSDGPCQVDNTLTRTWIKIRECEDGVDHPATETVSCVYEATTTQSEQEQDGTKIEEVDSTTSEETESVGEVFEEVTDSMKKPLEKVPLIKEIVKDEETDDVEVLAIWGIIGTVTILASYIILRLFKRSSAKRDFDSIAETQS
jgi:hypothetical protein